MLVVHVHVSAAYMNPVTPRDDIHKTAALMIRGTVMLNTQFSEAALVLLQAHQLSERIPQSRPQPVQIKYRLATSRKFILLLLKSRP